MDYAIISEKISGGGMKELVFVSQKDSYWNLCLSQNISLLCFSYIFIRS